MSILPLYEEDLTSNPVDLVEHVIFAQDIAYERISDIELLAEIPAEWCNLRLWFNWRPEADIVCASCYFDTRIPRPRFSAVHTLLSLVNDTLQLGHFVLSQDELSVAFRYTFSLHGTDGITAEQIESFLMIAGQECERFYPALQLVTWGDKSAEDALQYAIFETAGEA